MLITHYPMNITFCELKFASEPKTQKVGSSSRIIQSLAAINTLHLSTNGYQYE